MRESLINHLLKKRQWIVDQLTNFPYRNPAHILKDLATFEEVEKELEIQVSYLQVEQ